MKKKEEILLDLSFKVTVTNDGEANTTSLEIDKSIKIFDLMISVGMLDDMLNKMVIQYFEKTGLKYSESEAMEILHSLTIQEIEDMINKPVTEA